jgi:hypothetical protein
MREAQGTLGREWQSCSKPHALLSRILPVSLQYFHEIIFEWLMQTKCLNYICFGANIKNWEYTSIFLNEYSYWKWYTSKKCETNNFCLFFFLSLHSYSKHKTHNCPENFNLMAFRVYIPLFNFNLITFRVCKPLFIFNETLFTHK